MVRIEDHLLKHLEAFTAFARRRVGDQQLAGDVVQESLYRAFKAADRLQDDENITAWFYRIMRHTIIDLHRRKDARQKATEKLEAEWDSHNSNDAHRAVCTCIAALLPTLKPEYADLIRRLDLEEQTPDAVAAALQLTPNNMRVRHHRARQQLRKQLEATCKVCAHHGCLDCHCKDG